MSVTAADRRAAFDRAGWRCEYCRLPHDDSDLDPLAPGPHVDHVIAQKHGGSDDLDNLACSCFRCNGFKGTDLATLDAAGDFVRLFDPRRQTWDDHFRLDAASGSIVGRTPTGAATAKLLCMNDLSRDALRREASAGSS